MSQKQIALDEYLTIPSAAAHSGYSEQYVRKLVRNGRVRGLQVGLTWLIEIASLERYLRAAQAADDRRWGPRETC